MFRSLLNDYGSPEMSMIEDDGAPVTANLHVAYRVDIVPRPPWPNANEKKDVDEELVGERVDGGEAVLSRHPLRCEGIGNCRLASRVLRDVLLRPSIIQFWYIRNDGAYYLQDLWVERMEVRLDGHGTELPRCGGGCLKFARDLTTSKIGI